MSLHQQKGTIKRIFPGFIKSTINRWVIGLSFFILSGIFLYYAFTPDYVVFPNQEMDFIAYDDRASGGHSQILKFSTDSSLHLKFELRAGFSNPYVGVTIVPRDLQPIDLSVYNTLKIQCKGQNIKALVISIYTPNTLDPRVFSGDEVWYQKTIGVSTEPDEYDVDLSDFKIPDWWLEGNQLMTEEVGPADFSNVRNINISSAYTDPLNGIRSFSIGSISFTRNNTPLGMALFITELFIIIVLLGLQWLNALMTRDPASVTVEYKPVDTVLKAADLNDVFRYINQYFDQEELTLEEVAKNTGYSPRRISGIIREQFHCNFKTYLNRLRINESKRLLRETDLSVGEVAYKVGFNNQSHFNRVFKEQEKISPSQFRSADTP